VSALELLELGSAMLHEAAGRRGAVGQTIGAAWPGARVAGPCRTVRIAAGDNLGIHRAIDRCQAGEVLCVSAPGPPVYGAFGEVVGRFALARGLAGVVLTTGVRDIEPLRELGLPVFAAGHAIQGTAKRDAGLIDGPVRIGAAVVRPGDWLVGDADGCVVIRAGERDTVTAAARAKVAAERTAIGRIEAGVASAAALGLPGDR
jgi:4-hydroxy-4-methyl-2-oxoglutarate aldolase